jgi:hypothetical protein
MRRLVGLTVLLLGLTVPTVAWAIVANAGDGTLSVRGGNGKVFLNFNGSVVGRIAHGRILATDPILSDGSGVDFWGCDRTRDLTDTTTLCSGDDIHFRAIGGRYQLGVRGTGIYLSAVGRGSVTIDGRGDDPSVGYDGVYSLNDNGYKSLPNTPTSFSLLAPSGG